MAYCAWAGKHLCGVVLGDAAPPDSIDDRITNEWYRACSHSSAKNYPYGILYSESACNTLDAGIEDSIAVSGLLTCEGGFPGIFNMSGNVWEWSNSCEEDDMLPPEQQSCYERGGSFLSDGPTARCGFPSVRQRNYRSSDLGFRCCGPG